jgi:hypothetical protein
MVSRRILWALLPLFILGCSDDSTTVQPPVPLTPDQQTVANVRSVRDALETYAAAHYGSYGEYYIPSLKTLGIEPITNVYSGESEPSTIRAAAPGQIGIEPYECGGLVLGYRVTGYGNDHLLITLEALDKVPTEVRYSHDVTVANAYLVMDAALRFAAKNDGEFSTDVAGDTDHLGDTLMDLFPYGLLLNPLTGAKTEPQDGMGLAIPGAIGYLGFDANGDGEIDGFQMEAYDCDGAVMLTLLPYSAYGEFIWSGSYSLRLAVETFAKASGHYPHDLDVEATPGGKTVLDLISEQSYEHVPYFINGYTQEHYVPTLGIATGKFTVGTSRSKPLAS